MILLTAALVTGLLLTGNRLHPDEALFATLGRLIAQGIDPFLSQTILLVDKPPLFYYTLAAGIAIDWDSEFAARLPGYFAGVLGIALLVRLGSKLWQSDPCGLLTAMFFTSSPFFILFAPTAFSDMLLVMWILASLTAVVEGRWGWGGLLAACALAVKQSALFLFPLIIGFGMVCHGGSGEHYRQVVGAIVRFATSFVLVTISAVIWNETRGSADFWLAGLSTNNPGRLIRLDEVAGRAHAWWGLLRLFTPTTLTTVLLFTGVLAQDMYSLRRPGSRDTLLALLLSSYLAAYLAFHWLVAFPVLDRYLLPMVPLMSLLAGYGARAMVHNQVQLTMLGFLVALLVGIGATKALSGDYPIGGDRGANDGIHEVAAFLSEQPPGSIVYYQSIGWQLSYYMFGSQQVIVHFDGPAALLKDVEVFWRPLDRRFIVLARNESQHEITRALSSAGFTLKSVYESRDRYRLRSFVVYQIAHIHD